MVRQVEELVHKQGSGLVPERTGGRARVGIVPKDEVPHRPLRVKRLEIREECEEVAALLRVVSRHPFDVHLIRIGSQIQQASTPDVAIAIEVGAGWNAPVDLLANQLLIRLAHPGPCAVTERPPPHRPFFLSYRPMELNCPRLGLGRPLKEHMNRLMHRIGAES